MNKSKKGNGRPKLYNDDDVKLVIVLLKEDYERLHKAAIKGERTIAGQARWYIRQGMDKEPLL